MKSKAYLTGVKLAVAAKGIPDRSRYGDISKFKPGDLVDFIIQKHVAARAGTHFDVRFGNRDTGLLSWATKKVLPEPGGRIAFFAQPLHTYAYKDFEGQIPKGYGKGNVKKVQEGKLLITKVTDESIHFTEAHKRNPRRFALIKPKEGKQWLLVNTTIQEPLPFEKEKFRSAPADQAEQILATLKPGSSVQPKIDGAASLTKLLKERGEVASYRRAKATGYPIVHTERMFQGPMTIRTPKEFQDSILRGELYGVKDGKAIKPQELGGLLNSTIANSITSQKAQGIELKNLLFDVIQKGNVLVNKDETPYQDRLQILREAMKFLPKEKFHLPENVTTEDAAQKLLKKIREGKHPLTSEGIVIHNPTGEPTKIKFSTESEVHITGISPGEGKYKDKAAGGFTYSLTPGGKTVGKVGTGFSDQMRKLLAEDPKAFIGRVARIHAQEQHPSGAYRSPSFIALKED